MVKFFKKVFKIGIFVGVSFIGFKIYKRIQESIKLSNTLPDFLKNVVGEKPKIRSQITLNQISLNLTFTKETLEKEKDIESIVKEYIEDFYPALASMKMKIEVNEAAETEKTEPETEKEVEEKEIEVEIEDTEEEEKE